MQVVLVDPSRTVCRIVGDLIKAWGYDIRCFASGEEALAHFQRDSDASALITSVELGAMSGLDLCAKARAIAGSERALYIILMSSSDERTKVVEALDNGADDFISKPPEPTELRARLRAGDRLTSMQSRLITLATRDYLTGLLTRRAFFETASRMLEKVRRGKSYLSVLACDLDRFKHINDTYGHEIGDRVLKEVGAEAKLLRVPVGRLGGEEFALLIEGRIDDAIDVAEQFRASIGTLSIRAGNADIHVSCSIGVAEWEPGDGMDSLLRRADVSLYEAKRTGRNRVVAADTFVRSQNHDNWRGLVRNADRGR